MGKPLTSWIEAPGCFLIPARGVTAAKTQPGGRKSQEPGSKNRGDAPVTFGVPEFPISPLDGSGWVEFHGKIRQKMGADLMGGPP